MKTKYATALLAAFLAGGAATAFAAESAVVQKVDDVTLLTKIKAELLSSKHVDGLDVNVDVKEGRVTLSGKASNEAERTRAETIARDTKGVMAVENRIVLKDH